MMEILIYFLIFIFGLIVGSFLNCLIYRLALPGFSLKNLGGLKSRSYCPNCKHKLSWQDLIPVFSFLILKGKCRYCHQKISWQYPLVEISTAILFLWTYLSYDRDFTMSLFFYWIFISFLIIIFVYDLKHYIIPDKIIYPAIILAFFYHFFEILEFRIWNLFGILDFGFGILKPLLNPLLSAFLALLFFLAIVLISRGKWMGVGDIKLAFLMGLLLSFPKILVALFLAFFIGAIVGILLITLGKKTLKSEIPFGPFLVTGTFLAIFFSQGIINWYLTLLLLK